MSIWDRFRPKGNVEIMDATNGVMDFFQGQPVYADISKMTAWDMYRTQPHLRTVISFLARNVAHCRFHTFVENEDGDRVRDRTSTFARLMRRPNDQMTGTQLMFALVADLALHDEAYWWVLPDVEAPTGWSIMWLPVPWVKPINATAFTRKRYDVSPPGADKLEIPAKQILHFHGYNPSDPRKGLPATDALKMILKEQQESANYRLQTWRKGGRVSAVLKRPIGAPRWSKKAKRQFHDDWYANYTGNGAQAGGTPILDDGMEMEKMDFSAREQEYVAGTKLAFNTCCSVYHINPTMVGLLDNANFSNTREFRKALYGDTLGPIFGDLEDRINTFLPPMLEDEGVDDGLHFGEFNVKEKLQGDFEQTTKALQSAVGAPWMVRNEARKLQNLPPVEGGDILITPLNVVTGAQASPNDSGTQNEGEDPFALAASSPKPGTKGAPLRLARKAEAAPSEAHRDSATAIMRTYFARQEKVVRARLGAKADDEWWDEERWDAELAEDLYALAAGVAAEVGPKTAKALGYSPSDYDEQRTEAFLRKVAESNAKNINAATKAQIDEALLGEDPSEGVASTFTIAKEQRSGAAGNAIVTAAAGFATVEAAQQVTQDEPVTVAKAWVAGSNPRATHAAMDGEVVGIDEAFSNGAQWPADFTLGAAESANCNCTVDVYVTSA